MKKSTFLLVLVLALVTLFACDNSTNEPTDDNQNTPSEVVLTVESIAIVGDYKTVYTQEDELDLSNLSIKVTYSDGSNNEIAVTKDMLSSVDMNTIGPKTITVTYEGKTATFNITVNPKVLEEVKLESIRVSGNFVREYTVGDELDLTNMVLVLTYSDQSTEEIAVTASMLGTVDMSVAGPKSVTVTYEGKTTSFDILVEAEEIVKQNPTVEFSIETGEKLIIGVDTDPVITVTPGDLEYTAYYSKDEVVVGSKFSDITESGTYALVVNVVGNEYYNDYTTWVVFKVSLNKLDATVEFSIESGATLYIGVDNAPTVTVTPSELEYEIFYTKDDGATNLGAEFPTEPGTYAINVKGVETDEYNRISDFRWFVLKPAPTQAVVAINPVFEELDNGALVLRGFVDSEGNNVDLASSLYTYHYSKNEVEVGTTVPTEVGTYAIVIELSSDANFEFIDRNIATLGSKVWKVFSVVDLNEDSTVGKIDVVFSFVEGGVVFGGFIDEEGNEVVLDASLFDVHYEANEINLGSELPTEAGNYAIVVELSSEANYEFITLNIPTVTKKVWQGFTVTEAEESGVKKIDPVFVETSGGLVFDGFIDLSGNYVDVDSSLYSIYYSSDAGDFDTLPTTPGSYSIVAHLEDNANYEFITLNNPNLTKHVWKSFTIQSSETISVILKTTYDDNQVLVVEGFTDAEGNEVLVDSSLYSVWYEKNEQQVLPENFVAGESYRLIVKFADGASFVFDTTVDGYAGNATKTWPKFYYNPVV